MKQAVGIVQAVGCNARYIIWYKLWVVMQPTTDTSTLDLIFIDMVENMVEYYEIPEILTPLSTSDHNVINWKSKCNIAEKGNSTKIKMRQFQPEQFDALLANHNWSFVSNTSGID